MKLIILGDVHGEWAGANASVQAALAEHPDAQAVIQMGDLGDGWPTRNGLNRWEPDFNLPIYVVDGNHENFDAIENGNTNPKLHWVPRGDVIMFDGLPSMFFGGATSPDFGCRTIGRDWWPQESIKRDQIELALKYQEPPPIHAMFCHERADTFPIPGQWNLPTFEGNPGASDRAALSILVKRYKPQWYFHGHWHFGHEHRYLIKGDGQFMTKVISCPVITNNEAKWTVFDGIQIWTNWS